MIKFKPERKASGKLFAGFIVPLAAVLQIAALTSCGGRIIKDDVRKCENISIVSYTSNSWYHWGEGDPAMADLARVAAFDTISILTDQSLIMKATLEDVDKRVKNGELIPGRTASNFGLTEIRRLFSSKGIRFDVKLSEDTPSRDNHSYGAVTSEILTALHGAVPAEYAVYVQKLNDYLQFVDPYGQSPADGMKIMHIPDVTPDNIKSISEGEGSAGTYYMIINAVYCKQGYTVFGSGSAEINCLMEAVMYNSKGEPVWKTEVEGTGSKFGVMQYFIFSWRSTENSVKTATSEALSKLVHQLKKDLKHISIKQEL